MRFAGRPNPGRIATISSGRTHTGHPGERASRRYPLNADVEVVEPVTANGVVINASEGGLRVALDRDVPLDVVCVLEVSVDGGKTVEMAKVVWVRSEPDGCLAGFEYVDE